MTGSLKSDGFLTKHSAGFLEKKTQKCKSG